jgi:HD superfamily phosphodiesterase
MYTLEKHLKYLSEENSCYEQLYSVWTLNYKNLSKGLNVISSLYPHYSSHDVSHSMAIVDNIQYFLGEDRIKKLGATDTFMLLMSCLTHDIGMILSYKIVEKEWKSEGFWNVIKEFSLSGDEVIAKAAKLLIDFNGRKDEDYSWAIEVKNAVTLLTAEIFIITLPKRLNINTI